VGAGGVATDWAAGGAAGGGMVVAEGEGTCEAAVVEGVDTRCSACGCC
jgi:hypothetical protein